MVNDLAVLLPGKCGHKAIKSRDRNVLCGSLRSHNQQSQGSWRGESKMPDVDLLKHGTKSCIVLSNMLSLKNQSIAQ